MSGEAFLLDTRGMRCPRPIIELARLARDADDGAEIRVLSDDPAAPGDIEAWCRMRGHAFDQHEFVQQDKVPVFTTSRLRVRRTPAGAAAAGPYPAGPGTPAG